MSKSTRHASQNRGSTAAQSKESVGRTGDLPREADSDGRTFLRRLLVALALAVVTFGVYARVLTHDFVYLDDRMYVTENGAVLKGLTWEGVKWAFKTFEASNWHPLTWLSHMLDVSVYGLDPQGHHLTSLALHVINVVLLFYLLSRMTGAGWPSAFVAGAFALHPAHVESVAWVAERKDALSTCLGLLTLIAYVRYSEARSVRRYVPVIALYALSLLAKPMMVTLPCLMLLLDYWPLRRASSGPTPLNPSLGSGEARLESLPLWTGVRLVAEKLPLLALGAASSIVTVYAQRAGGALMTEKMLPLEARFPNAIVAYGKYLWMTIWPTGLAAYYPLPLKPYSMFLVVGIALALFATTVVVVLARRNRPHLLVGWLWFVGMLVPVIGLVQVGGQAFADRYTYLPVVGLFIMAAWSAKSWQQGNKASRQQVIDSISTARTRIGVRSAIGMFGVGMLAVLGVCTWVQAGYWRDSITLFQRALDVVPENTQAHMFMANTLVRQGRVAEAVPHFAEAVRIVPNEPYNMTDYGHALLDMGQLDEAGIQLERALSLQPDLADAHFFLGVTRLKQGRYFESEMQLEKALARDPRLTKAHLHLGAAYAGLNQWAEAITHLQKWLTIDPRSIEALTQLAKCFYSVGNEAAAKETLQKAVNIDPRNPFPLALQAQLAAWSGQIESAISLYDQALQADPNYAEAANNLALILATHPDDKIRDGARALKLAELAAKAHGYKDSVSLDTLAAAYAEVGRFPDAVKTIESAIALAGKTGAPEWVAQLKQRRDIYVSGKPVRAE